MKTIKMNKVLVALDYNPTAQKVAEVGYSIAKAMGADCMLIHILSSPIIYTSVNYDPIMGFSDLEALKFQFVETRKIMSPANIIKSTFNIKDFKSKLINIALGTATNYLIDKFPSISNENLIQKIVKQLFKYNK
jgi:hypothetical protein